VGFFGSGESLMDGGVVTAPGSKGRSCEEAQMLLDPSKWRS
jgi:hypothetical protein